MIDDFHVNQNKMTNHEKFCASSNIIDKSVKSFLNHEYIGDEKSFDSNSVRPFIKTMNVFEDIYKVLFQIRGHGAVESIAKVTLDEGIFL